MQDHEWSSTHSLIESMDMLQVALKDGLEPEAAADSVAVTQTRIYPASEHSLSVPSGQVVSSSLIVDADPMIGSSDSVTGDARKGPTDQQVKGNTHSTSSIAPTNVLKPMEASSSDMIIRQKQRVLTSGRKVRFCAGSTPNQTDSS